MSFPTPSGNAPLSTQLTSQAWMNQPTTQATFNQTVSIVSAQDGATKANQFKGWYQNAWATDSQITPNQAVADWLTGATIAAGTGSAATALGQIPGAAATGAENAANNIGNVLNVANPLNYLKPVAGFFNALTQGNTWLRVLEVGAGAMILYLGLKSTFQNTAVGSGARQVKKHSGAVAGTAKTLIKFVPK